MTPEVSTIDFTLGTTLVQGGRPVPGLNTRRTETTVELEQGQTLAIAGLLRVDLEATTNRIPASATCRCLGTLFSNTAQRVEKELLVLVTPYLIRPMEAHQVPPLPGTEIRNPTDCEFYFLSRIEGRTRQGNRPTVDYDYIERHQRMHYNRDFIKVPSVCRPTARSPRRPGLRTNDACQASPPHHQPTSSTNPRCTPCLTTN